MILHFDKHGKYRGHSMDLLQFLLTWFEFGVLIIIMPISVILIPVITIGVLLSFKNNKESKNQWNPYRNKLVFILMNIVWAFGMFCLIQNSMTEEVPKKNSWVKPQYRDGYQENNNYIDYTDGTNK